MEKQLLLLMKIGEYKYMKNLLEEGTLFLRRLSEYRDIEQNERGDKNDGISSSFQPGKVKVKINGTEIKNIIGPIRTIEGKNNLIYCMYGFNSLHANCNPNQLIDDRCYSFGDTAIIIKDGKEFFERIKKACQKHKSNFEARLVEYVDPNEYHGDMGSFRKYNDYSHQHEFRIVFENSFTNPTYELKIGALHDIAELHPLDNISKIVRIN